jgi:hypothetical protein
MGTFTIIRNFIPIFIAIIHPPPPTRPVELKDGGGKSGNHSNKKDIKGGSAVTAGGGGGVEESETSSGGFLMFYSGLLKKHPFLIGAPQHALILSLANITKQFVIFSTSYETAASLSTPHFVVNWTAVKHGAILGGVAMAPLHFVWFQILNKYFKDSPMKKVLVDQFIASWFFNVYAQFVLTVLNGESFAITRDIFNVVFIR